MATNSQQHCHHVIQKLTPAQILFMGVQGEFRISLLHMCCRFSLSGITENVLNCLFCLFGDLVCVCSLVWQPSRRCTPSCREKQWITPCQNKAIAIQDISAICRPVLVWFYPGCCGFSISPWHRGCRRVGGLLGRCRHQACQLGSAPAAAAGNDRFAQPQNKLMRRPLSLLYEWILCYFSNYAVFKHEYIWMSDSSTQI